MSMTADTEHAVAILEKIQEKFQASGDASQEDDIAAIICMLDSSLFKQLLNVQISMKELKDEVESSRVRGQADFDITPTGDLVLSESAGERPMHPRTMRSKEDRAEALQQYAMSNDAFDWDDADEPSSEYLGSGAVPYTTKAVVENGDSSQELMKYGSDFHHAVMMASQGREVQVIQLFKPEGGGLGFSVVGLKSENRGELGIFVQDIQPTGVASHDGRLQESDQILAIDGQPLDASISHQQAIGILQQAQGLVELVVARGGIPNIAPIVRSATPSLDRTPSAVSSVSQQSGVITAEHPFIQWGHVEEIVLHNDGTGLGFGIIGGKSAGVVVKTILPGGVASRDGRLRSGDHILKIGDTSLAGMNSENVATVLRQSGSTVTLTVARNPMLEQPSSLSSNQQQSIPVVAAAKSSTPVPQQDEDYNLHRQQEQTTDLDVEVFEVELVKDSMGLGITIAGYVGQGISGDVSGIFVKSVAKDSTADRSGKVKVHDQIIEVDGTSLDGYDNKEAVDVLRHTGTVVKLKLARYNAGSIVQPSPVEQPPQPSPPPPPPSSESQYETFPPVYQDTDIVAVASSFTDEEPQGPPAAYLVAGSDDSDEDDMLAGYLPPSSVFVAPQQQNQQPPPPPYVEVNNAAYMDDDYTSDLSPQAEEAIKAHWMNILGPDAEVEVAQISKFHQGGGLGISLEGTVDIEDGEEVRPHHYIRSILPDGPVGQNGKLKSGDELLEVNGTQLLGLHHVDVIGILKELPMCVRIVVGRHGHPLFPDRGLTAESQKIENSPMLAQLTASEPNLFGVQSGGGDASEGLAKAHSESTLLVQDEKPARILDTSSGLAMWSDAPTEIILIKADRGLGFSILDYQDPMNPEETVIVIRSLVPGGVADQDSRLIPGDRLVYVNDTHLDNCTLEKAVQALKGAPQGPVRIGVAKPLALSESAHRDEVSSSIKELQMQEISLDQLEDDEIKQIQDSSSSSSSSSKSEEDNELERLEAARKEAMAAMNLFAVTTGKEEPQRPPSPKMDEKHDDEERIETVRREAMQAMNQYAVTTGKDPTPQTEAPHFRAPPPLFDSSSEDLDVDDVEVKREKTKSDEEKEKIETVRREAMAAMNMYATTTGQKAAEQPVEKLKTPSPPPEPQSFTPIPPPRPQQSDEQKERLEAARREAMMAMNSYAMETGQKTQEIRPVSPKLEPKQLHVRQPSPEPEPVEDNTEEEKRLEAMRVEEVMALNAFAIASVQEPQEMEIVAATPVMIESDSDEEVEFPPLPAGPPPPLPFQPPPTEEEEEIVPYFSESQSDASMTPSFAVAALDMQDDGSTGSSPMSSPGMLDRKAVVVLPCILEKTVRLNKGNAGLGFMTAAEKGNGVIVKSITRGGIVDIDGRIKVGDYITAVNSESMRDLTNSQARSLLRRCSLIGTDIRTETREFSEDEPVVDTPAEKVVMATVKKSKTPPPVPQKPHTKKLTTDGSPAVNSARWEPVRSLELLREPNKSLGISIVGGRVGEGHIAQGIFIKHVLEDSPAGKNGTLKTGDRILEVNGNDLRTATHDHAVEIIRHATSPVQFLVQSLAASTCPDDLDLLPNSEEDLQIVTATMANVEQTTYVDGVADVTQTAYVEEIEEPSDNEDSHSVSSDGDNVLDTGDEQLLALDGDEECKDNESSDDEPVDEFGYTWKKIKNKYGDLPGELLLIDLEKNENGLGLSLAGNRDRNKASVFIVGVKPDGAAAEDGRINVGDEILEINGTVLYGRSHQNASAIIKGIHSSIIKMIILRSTDNMAQLAVPPLQFYPVLKSKGDFDHSPHHTPKKEHFDSNIEYHHGDNDYREDFSTYSNVQNITLRKGAGSLGLAIQARNSGIFIKDITFGGAAFQDGRLHVGDQLLAVDNKSLIGITQEKAIVILKNTQQTVHLTVSGQGEKVKDGDLTPVNRSPLLTPVNQSPISKVAPVQFAETTVSSSLTTVITMEDTSTSPSKTQLNRSHSPTIPLATVYGSMHDDKPPSPSLSRQPPSDLSTLSSTNTTTSKNTHICLSSLVVMIHSML
ncbi:multiple PDZ domain protein-like [Saccoglossus kowalevskii]